MKRSLLLVGALVVAFVVLSAGVVLGASMFSDVPDDHPFSSDIEWLFAADVTKGCNAGTEFCPEDEVTRGQMAAFMRRFAKFLGAEDGTVNSADTAGSVGGWTAADIAALEQRIANLEACTLPVETLAVGYPEIYYVDLDTDTISDRNLADPPAPGVDFHLAWNGGPPALPDVFAENGTAYAVLSDTAFGSVDVCAIDVGSYVYNAMTGVVTQDDSVIARTTEGDYYLMKVYGPLGGLLIDYVKIP
jgi:hypothetical protein